MLWLQFTIESPLNTSFTLDNRLSGEIFRSLSISIVAQRVKYRGRTSNSEDGAIAGDKNTWKKLRNSPKGRSETAYSRWHRTEGLYSVQSSDLGIRDRVNTWDNGLNSLQPQLTFLAPNNSLEAKLYQQTITPQAEICVSAHTDCGGLI